MLSTEFVTLRAVSFSYFFEHDTLKYVSIEKASMTSLRIGLVSNEHFASERINFLSSCLAHWVPELQSLDTYDMGCQTIQNHSPTGWSIEDLVRLMQCPVIVKSNLTNPLNFLVSPEKIFIKAIGVHTRIQVFFIPKIFRFFLVFSPECGGFSPARDSLESAHDASFHTALELSMTHGERGLHQVGVSTSSSLAIWYPKVKVSSFSSFEAIHHLIHSPHSFRVVHSSHAYAGMIHGLLKTLHQDQLATVTIDVGPNSIAFSAEESKTSFLFSISLLLHSISYPQTAAAIEDFLSAQWQELEQKPFSWIQDRLIQSIPQGPKDQRSSWHQLARKYYNLSSQNAMILGFDIMMKPSSSLHNLGSGLEELTASCSFYLESIAHKNLQLYPISPLVPSFDTSWCCRFLARSSFLKMQDIGMFIERLSTIYPWICIALLYELDGKRNFEPFISMS